MTPEEREERFTQAVDRLSELTAILTDRAQNLDRLRSYARDVVSIDAGSTIDYEPRNPNTTAVLVSNGQNLIISVSGLSWTVTNQLGMVPIPVSMMPFKITNPGSSRVVCTLVELGESMMLGLSSLMSNSITGTVGLTGSLTWQNGVFDVPDTATQMPSAAGSTVTLLAADSNTDTVFIGNSSNNATFPLYAGQSAEISISNLNLIWATASATGNTLYWSVN